MRTIMIPLDGSAFSEQVLAHVHRFGPAESSRLLLVQVIELDRAAMYVAPDVVHVPDTSHWLQDAENYLFQHAEELRQAGRIVSTVVMEGDVVRSLGRVAESENVDLIAMTTHGRSGLGRWLLGSVAQGVVRAAQRPVYLVRPGHDGAAFGASRDGVGRCIAVPLDGSELAEQALPLALDWVRARGPGGVLWLVQAIERPNLWLEEFMAAEAMADEPSTQQRLEQAHVYLAEITERLASADLRIETHVAIGPAEEVVSKLVTLENVDTVVMSTHARGGLDRLVLGSVAEQVLRAVGCPLLMLPPGVAATTTDETSTDAATTDAATTDAISGSESGLAVPRGR